MTYTFTLTGEVPSKKNGRIATSSGRNFPSTQYQKWHKAASLQIATQKHPAKPIEKCKAVYMIFYHEDEHRRDTNNQMASVFDLLVDCKVLKDDCWTVTNEETGKGVLCDKSEARCKVVIDV